MANVAHTAKVYVKASAASVISGDELDGINDFSASSSKTILDITDFKDTSGAKAKLAGLEDGSFSISGDFEAADAPQMLVRSSFDSGAAIWLTILFDGTAGYKYACLVENYEVKGGVDGKLEWSASLTMNGAKTAV